jgi:hemerythrin-like domain-containing protein
MTAQITTTTKLPKMAHGHTRLIWLLDDIEAHLDGIRGSEDPALIIEELISYTREFNDELDEHIGEEETRIFPAAARVASQEELEELDEIHDEHRQIEAQLQEFWEVLSQGCEQKNGARHGVCCDKLIALVSKMRQTLAAHSAHERQFLSQVEPRVEDLDL